MTKRAGVIYLALTAALLVLVIGYYAVSFTTAKPGPVFFDGSRALADVQTQVNFGPRIPGTAGHAQVRAWMRSELESAGWVVEIHESTRLGHPIYNIIAKRGEIG